MSAKTEKIRGKKREDMSSSTKTSHTDFERCTTDVAPLVTRVSRTHKRCPAAKVDAGQGRSACIDRQCRNYIRHDQEFCHMHLRSSHRRRYVGPREGMFDFRNVDLRDPSSHARIVEHYLKRTSALMCHDVVSYMKTLPHSDDEEESLRLMEQRFDLMLDLSMNMVSDMLLRCLLGGK